MTKTIQIETERTCITVLKENQSPLIIQYYLDNKEHQSQWEPVRTEEFYTKEYWAQAIHKNTLMLESGAAYKFAILNKDRSRVIGICNFNNVVQGVFQACHLGYAIGKEYEGNGYMSEALTAAMDYIFKNVGLHRIMANYVPENKRSEALLNRLGFEKEGYAKSYLKINGIWRDHILTAKLNPYTDQ